MTMMLRGITRIYFSLVKELSKDPIICKDVVDQFHTPIIQSELIYGIGLLKI